MGKLHGIYFLINSNGLTFNDDLEWKECSYNYCQVKSCDWDVYLTYDNELHHPSEIPNC